jgi:hypothetical protein
MVNFDPFGSGQGFSGSTDPAQSIVPDAEPTQHPRQPEMSFEMAVPADGLKP